MFSLLHPLKRTQHSVIHHVANTFNTCNLKIEVFWDFSNAKFDVGPKPITGFFLMGIRGRNDLTMLEGVDGAGRLLVVAPMNDW